MEVMGIESCLLQIRDMVMAQPIIYEGYITFYIIITVTCSNMKIQT